MNRDFGRRRLFLWSVGKMHFLAVGSFAAVPREATSYKKLFHLIGCHNSSMLLPYFLLLVFSSAAVKVILRKSFPAFVAAI